MSTTANDLASFCLPDNRVTFFRPISKTKPTSGALADESPWPAPRPKRGGNRVWFLNRPDLWPNIEYGMNRAGRLLTWEAQRVVHSRQNLSRSLFAAYYLRGSRSWII